MGLAGYQWRAVSLTHIAGTLPAVIDDVADVCASDEGTVRCASPGNQLNDCHREMR